MTKSSSNLRRDAVRLRVFRRFLNGDVVALRQVRPCRRVCRDVNGNVLFMEHLAACEAGTWCMTFRGTACLTGLMFRRLVQSGVLSMLLSRLELRSMRSRGVGG